MRTLPFVVGADFFPRLPLAIPHSPGVKPWWDLFWWMFQLAAMSFLLIYFRRSAEEVDDGSSSSHAPKGKREPLDQNR
ncbi:MAG: hypothetical protein OWU84_14770 [Firmicutes bacterium]|nr:hypothetical protein [Bacillota bacterium]